VAVWRGGAIGDRIPSIPPFLSIEILSPEDRITRMQPKIAEYLSIRSRMDLADRPYGEERNLLLPAEPRGRFVRSSTD